MSQTKAARPAKALLVVDFTCDSCKKPLDAIAVMQASGVRKIAKTYHRECWNLLAMSQTVKPSRSN